MVLIFTSEDSDKTAELEIGLIKRFRGDPILDNHKPGGASAHHGRSPYFTYIVFGTHHAFERGRGAVAARRVSWSAFQQVKPRS